MHFFPDIPDTSRLYGVVDGAHNVTMARLLGSHKRVVFVARDDNRMAQMASSLAFLLPEIPVISLPAWDCLPYDRVSPHSSVVSERVACLSALVKKSLPESCIILTSINSWMQLVPPPSYFEAASLSITLDDPAAVSQPQIIAFLAQNGFYRTQTVREFGEYAVRGGIVDVYAKAEDLPFRLDFFGDELDQIRKFDPLTQKSVGDVSKLDLVPAAEYALDQTAISKFRAGYVEAFGAVGARDPIYEAVSAGKTPVGIEHWLSLLHPQLVELSSYLSDWQIVFDHEAEAAATLRLEQLQDFYQSRLELLPHASDAEEPYRPVAVETMYRHHDKLASEGVTPPVFLSSFSAPDDKSQDIKGKSAPSFAAARTSDKSPSEAAAEIINAKAKTDVILLVATSDTALNRLSELIGPHLNRPVKQIRTASEITADCVCIALWPLETGFEIPGLWVATEQDIYGTRMSRPPGKRRKSEDFLREVSSLEAGDLVVHVEHGIGRFDGLEIIQSGGGAHECLRLIYGGGDRLFLPVENIELLSRYGQEGTEASLDKLGGVAWQARKARIKGRIKEMAEQLMKIAAQRQMANAEILTAPDGAYAEFCARFGYTETDDQLDAIADVLDDLTSGKATDRLICGDVGFGKTEVAMRAAFIAAMCGFQVALITPTTLLARQHGKVFTERFAGFPIKIGTLSRLTTAADARQLKAEIEDGTVQIAIGTHALLAKQLQFNNLGLLIVDEEQNFGVAQKERLKSLRGDIHVLTLSATPIPRTLQMALSGVRQMSIIATPPVDRLAVRTFVGPWDGMVLREAILRERFRGGQVFVVCPRIADLNKIYDRLIKLVPEAKILSAHGQMSPAELDKVMTDFSEGKADLLLSTNIVESGIDIPTANTIIIHRADMFGLSQLYQLRGRVGRSKVRAYAYLTTDSQKLLTDQAKRRLQVMQTLDKLGAGFSLASYDMDIRGAGNLLGDEQSGHVKEVGIELYQDMLRQAVEMAKQQSVAQASDGSATLADEEDGWSPQITLGTSVLIPEAYVPDLTVRLSLYRRISNLSDDTDMKALMEEMQDRFGQLPSEVINLVDVISLKQLCRKLNIEKIDAGGKGFAISFRNNEFDKPEALVAWIAGKAGQVLLKADQRLIVKADLSQIAKRAEIANRTLQELAALQVR